MSAAHSETAAARGRLTELAWILDNAAAHAKAVPQITQSLTLAEAYAVQKESIDLRLQRGERLVGIKMGFTSRVKAAQMGVSDVIWGRLTDAMKFQDGAVLNLRRFVHPRVEPEIVFRMKKSLSGLVTRSEALEAIDAVAPGLEIIDSRFEAFKFSLTDVVADNASSSAFVLGPWQAPDIDLANLLMTLAYDGEIQASGSSAALLDHPLNSLIAAARLVEENRMSLEPGWIVLAGGATAACALRPGVRVSLQVEALGGAGFSMGI